MKRGSILISMFLLALLLQTTPTHAFLGIVGNFFNNLLGDDDDHNNNYNPGYATLSQFQDLKNVLLSQQGVFTSQNSELKSAIGTLSTQIDSSGARLRQTFEEGFSALKSNMTGLSEQLQRFANSTIQKFGEVQNQLHNAVSSLGNLIETRFGSLEAETQRIFSHIVSIGYKQDIILNQLSMLIAGQEDLKYSDMWNEIIPDYLSYIRTMRTKLSVGCDGNIEPVHDAQKWADSILSESRTKLESRIEYILVRTNEILVEKFPYTDSTYLENYMKKVARSETQSQRYMIARLSTDFVRMEENLFLMWLFALSIKKDYGAVNYVDELRTEIYSRQFPMFQRMLDAADSTFQSRDLSDTVLTTTTNSTLINVNAVADKELHPTPLIGCSLEVTNEGAQCFSPEVGARTVPVLQLTCTAAPLDRNFLTTSGRKTARPVSPPCLILHQNVSSFAITHMSSCWSRVDNDTKEYICAVRMSEKVEGSKRIGYIEAAVCFFDPLKAPEWRPACSGGNTTQSPSHYDLRAMEFRVDTSPVLPEANGLVTGIRFLQRNVSGIGPMLALEIATAYVDPTELPGMKDDASLSIGSTNGSKCIPRVPIDTKNGTELVPTALNKENTSSFPWWAGLITGVLAGILLSLVTLMFATKMRRPRGTAPNRGMDNKIYYNSSTLSFASSQS